MVTDQARAGGGAGCSPQQVFAHRASATIWVSIILASIIITALLSSILPAPRMRTLNTGDSKGKIKYRKETELCAKKKFTPKIKFRSRKTSCNGQEGRVAGGRA